MNATMKTIGLIGMVLLAMLMLLSLYTVEQTQYALKLQFGKVKGVELNPGLHWKVPLIQKVIYFDNRIQTLDAKEGRFLTSEKKNVIVDAYVKWRIVDVVKYYTDVRGNEQLAGQRLSEVIADGLRGKFGSRTIQDVVAGDRTLIMEQITEEADQRARSFGIKVVDVRIKRIDLPDEVSESVYQRMRAERERVARNLRAQGEAEAVRITADANRQRVVVLAEAKRQAEQLRGEGEAEAAKTYAQAFGQDEEFFSLYRSFAAYRKTFQAGDHNIFILEPDSEFFTYFNHNAIAK